MEFDKSLEYLARAKPIIPVCSQTFSKGPAYMPLGVSPVYIQKGEGSHVWDVDGNEFIDWICGLGPITLGYNYPRVNEAIEKQLKDSGIIFSLPHPLEIELSELLVDIIPCAEMVRFAKNGTDATNAAVRLARAYTGKEKIAFRGYHGGGNDWYGITTERSAGIPKVLEDYAIPFEYNNLDSLENILKNNDVAGVILEPVIVEPPRDNFLRELVELSHHYETVVIFDEIVTGFRWALGGAQEYFEVTPDLATFGKGMANGMPLSAVVGRVDIMREMEDIFFSYTFGGECLSLAAGLATIREMKEKKTITHNWVIGKTLVDGLKKLGIECIGYPCRPMLKLPDESIEYKSLFMQELIKRGILVHSGLLINICYSHSLEDVDKTLNAFEDVLKVVKAGVKLRGELVIPAFRRL